jgi:hypothetical protein
MLLTHHSFFLKLTIFSFSISFTNLSIRKKTLKILMKHVKKMLKILKNPNKNPEKLQMIQKEMPFLHKKLLKQQVLMTL